MHQTHDEVVESAAAQSVSEVQELNDLELAFIAGGVGEVIVG